MKRIIVSVFVFVFVGFSYAQQLPYQNPNLSAKERAADLCSRLTLEEKAQLMVNSSPAIPRLGIPEFSWWNEALHGVARNGRSTVFPSCIGMAASFDETLLYKVYTATSDEARAKNTEARKKGSVKRYQGTSFWTPNINIFRDPRWGRGQETYGEDPYLTSRMGGIVVKGLQGTPFNSSTNSHRYYKSYACAKHFAVHSGPESTRHRLNLDNVSPRDLFETYMPAFKSLVMDAGVKEVMCAYQRLYDEPCCGNNKLLTQILRNEWGFNGLVVSDCGAIRDFYAEGHHEVSPNKESAGAKAVLAGTDVNCGSVYNSLPQSVEQGYIKESDIDVSVKRLLEGRFELGDFDADELNDWTQIPLSCVCSPEHKQIALDMARETIVLLHNKKNALPLKKTDRFIVMGPNAADSVVMWSIYYGNPTHTVTIKEGIDAKTSAHNFTAPFYKACELTSFNVAANKKVQKVLEYGTDDFIPELDSKETSRSIETALQEAKDYNTVIFVGGISPIIEREEARIDMPGFKGGDRTSIELPQVQRDILNALHKAGKKVIFVSCSGSAIAMTPELESCDAILQVWYPGEQGGHAVADVLFGDYNPSGKLPVTFYKDDSVLGDFEDYSMKGKTYRYFNGEALFPFGYGLSYTTFKLSKPVFEKQTNVAAKIAGTVSLDIKNTGKKDGTEVVQVYLKCLDDAEGPIKTLRGYQRIELKAGESKHISIDMPESAFECFDTETNTMRIVPGNYQLLCGTSSDMKDLKVINLKID